MLEREDSRMTLSPMTGADGQIYLYWIEMESVAGVLVPRTKQRIVNLSDIILWEIEDGCLVFLYPDHREMSPINKFSQINIQYNSPAGVEALRKNKIHEIKAGEDDMREFATIRILDGGRA
jgi:hypothetical protein